MRCAGVPNDGRSRQDRHVAARDGHHCARGIPPSGAIDLCDGSAVDPNHNVSGGIRGGEAENQSRLLAFNSAGHEDGSDENESPLQIERGVQQVGQRSVDDAT